MRKDILVDEDVIILDVDRETSGKVRDPKITNLDRNMLDNEVIIDEDILEVSIRAGQRIAHRLLNTFPGIQL